MATSRVGVVKLFLKDGVALVFNDITATKTSLFLALREVLLRPPLLNTHQNRSGFNRSEGYR
jgi:hypothetical protein